VSSDLLLDTGPLVLLVVGAADAKLLGATQHLKAFTPQDAPLLEGVLRLFRSIWITPHVATEASHFVTKISGKHGPIIKAKLVEVINAIDERPATSRTATARAEFAWLDLADFLETALPDDTLLSMDAMLVTRRLNLGFQAINFNHIREQAGLL
jgi:hypothetical protein